MVHGLLTAVASCCGTQVLGAQASVVAAARRLSCRGSLQCTDSAIVVAHGLSCSVVMWDLPGSRIEPVSPALAGSLPLSLQGSPSK